MGFFGGLSSPVNLTRLPSRKNRFRILGSPKKCTGGKNYLRFFGGLEIEKKSKSKILEAPTFKKHPTTTPPKPQLSGHPPSTARKKPFPLAPAFQGWQFPTFPALHSFAACDNKNTIALVHGCWMICWGWGLGPLTPIKTPKKYTPED